MENNDFEMQLFGPTDEADVTEAPTQTLEEETQVAPVVEDEAGTSEEASVESEPGTQKQVPLAALQKSRESNRTISDENRELKSRLEALEARLAGQNSSPSAPAAQQAAPQAVTPPDPYDDPAGYTAFVQNQIAEQASIQAQRVYALQNLNDSRLQAVEKYGKDFVDSVADWAGEQASIDPHFERKMFEQKNPAQWVIDQKAIHDEFNSFKADRDAFLTSAWEARGLANAPAVATTPMAKKTSGPATLAKAKSANAEMKAKDAGDGIHARLFGGK